MTPEARKADPFGFLLTGKAIALIGSRIGILLLVFLPLYAIWTWGMFSLANSAMAVEGALTGGASGIFLRIAAYQVLLALGGAVLAVMWHRAVLLPDGIAPPPGRVLGYIGWTFLIWLVMLAVTIIPGLLSWALFQILGPDAFTLMRVVAWLLNLVLAYLILRVGLVLPATSVGDSDMDMLRSIFVTGGRGLGLWIVAFLPILFLQLKGWAGPLLYKIDVGLAQAGGQVLTALGLLFGLAVLTALYDDHLKADGDPGA